MSRLLVIGDIHAVPGYDNDRCRWLGHYITQVRPDIVYCTGDVADMASLSAWDARKAAAEGKRVKEDIAVANDALDKLWGPVKEYNTRRRASRKAAYDPRRIITLGNHEHRLTRYANENPALLGYLGTHQFDWVSKGWEVYPYKQPVVVDGWALVHEWPGARGKTPARSLILSTLKSTIQGHIHTFDSHTSTCIDGSRIHGIVSGCYVHLDYAIDWANRSAWREGVILLDGVQNGDYASMTWVSQAELKRRFG